jgi:hypothetical protein
MQLSTVRRLHPRGEPFFVYAERDRARREVGVDVAGTVAFEDGLPVRTFPVYKGKRHFDGLHFFGPTASHVPFESSLEREAMLWFEYAGAVAVASQPFAVEWPPGSRPQRHVPDLFVRYANGTGEVVDVRPPHRADDPHFLRQPPCAPTQAWGIRYSRGSRTPCPNPRQCGLQRSWSCPPTGTPVALPRKWPRLLKRSRRGGLWHVARIRLRVDWGKIAMSRWLRPIT